MKKIKILSSLTFAVCFAACMTKQEFKYPITRTEPFDTTIFDVKISMNEVIGTLKFMLWQSGHPEFKLKSKN